MLRVAFLLGLLITAPLAAEIIELTNGDRLTATVVEQTDEQVVIDHPVLGRLSLPAAQVVSVSDETAAEQVAEVAVPTAAASIPKEPTRFTQIGEHFLPGWDRRFEIGLDGAEGNTVLFNFRTAFTGDYEKGNDRLHIGSAYTRKTTDGDKTSNNFFAEVIKDKLIPHKRYFYFTQARYDYDDFQVWRQRAAVGGGVGYPFVEDDPKLSLIGRFGGGANYAWGGGGNDEITPEALLGLEGKWKIDDTQSFEFKTTFYPDLKEQGEFRNLTALAYLLKLDHAKGMSLKLGLDNEYLSTTDDDSKQNNLTYYAALVFGF